MATEPATFRATQLDTQGRRYVLDGVIDEQADLSFFSRLQGRVELNLRGVRRVNSFGVRSWIQELRKTPPDAELELHECPPAIVDQINMIAGFTSRATVASFLAPLMCAACDIEETRVFSAVECRRLGGKLPPAACPRCGGAMELLELEQQYLYFLRL